jgi:hypothetical protein
LFFSVDGATNERRLVVVTVAVVEPNVFLTGKLCFEFDPIIIISFSKYDLLKLINCFVNAVVVVGPTIKEESMSGKTLIFGGTDDDDGPKIMFLP